MSTKILTKEEWAAVRAPLFWTKVTNAAWGKTEREFIVKWMESHLGKGWVYYDGEVTYAFESDGDQMLFKIWIKSDPFDGDDGVVA